MGQNIANHVSDKRLISIYIKNSTAKKKKLD